jgi:hypothetical protein
LFHQNPQAFSRSSRVPQDRGKLHDTRGAVNEKKHFLEEEYPVLSEGSPDMLNSSMKNDIF